MEKVKILFLAASPDTAPLRLDEEIREINAKIRAAEQREALEVVSCWAVRPDDLQQALLEHKPHILHFSGHGNHSDEIILLDDKRQQKPVSRAALVSLLRTLQDNLRVVVLNACFSREQAEAITEIVDCAIGMNKAIGDEAAIKFAASFYRGLGFGKSVRTSFDLGTSSLMLEDIPEEETPELMTRQSVDASSVFLFEADQFGEDGPEHEDGGHLAHRHVINTPQTVRIVRVFVSSPGDVEEERKILEKVVRRINQTDGDDKGYRLELWRWERDAVPQMGPSAQQVVDAQMPTDYEIYVGILAHRFGTPTDGYGSGTEKEFRDAVACWERTERPWILLYFKKEHVDPDALDLEQFQKVKSFRTSIQSKGLYKTYEGVGGSEMSFADQVEIHLRKLISKVLKAPEPEQQPTDTAQPILPQQYLTWLQAQAGDDDLLGLQIKEGRALKLDNVYVPLTTLARQRELNEGNSDEPQHDRDKPQLLLDLLDQKSLYVSGDPGSGKSTFSRWVAWLACSGSPPARTPPEPEDYAESFPETFRGRLPLLVRLRDFWPFLPSNAWDSLPLSSLEKSLAAWTNDRLSGRGVTWPVIEAHLQQGTLLLILDGVDEVPVSSEGNSRDWYPRSLLISGLSEAIPAWTRIGNRVLLTSRPYGLDEPDRQRVGLLDAPIEHLPQELQRLLVRRWFSILRESVEQGTKYADDMLADLQGRTGISELSSNPMLLTAMCIIYNEGKRLPQDRCDLYTRIVDNVLYSRFRVPNEIEMVRNELCVVSHAMHAGLGDDRPTPRAQVKYDEIDRALEQYREQRRWTQAGFEDLLQRREQLLSHTGLLLPRGDNEASFFHLSIQEFLAAQRLWALESDNLAQVFIERAEVPEWRNTLSFLFGTQLSRIAAPEPSIRLVENLIGCCRSDQLGLQVVLGDCLQILLGKDIRVPQEAEDRFRQMCLDAIENEVPLRERSLLGLALGHVGDPRIVQDLRDERAYVEIPAGTYAYQGGTQVIDEPFLLSKYPVTNSQYALFIEEGGYKDQQWWSEEGWNWREKQSRTEPDYWRRPEWNNPNQPVVTVTYWEAEAFCRWAGVELPSEKLWEAAARGSEGRVYPWGDQWEDGICNSREAQLGMTSPVGLFPRSRTKDHGLEDLAGNVREWCQPETERESHRRVLRGGSWLLDAYLCRCSSRGRWLPNSRDDVVGFRLARTYP